MFDLRRLAYVCFFLGGGGGGSKVKLHVLILVLNTCFSLLIKFQYNFDKQLLKK